MRTGTVILSLLIAFAAISFFIVDPSRAEKPVAVAIALETPASVMRYALDPARSTFMVHAFRGGLAWFKGHDHYIAARDFSGVAELSPEALNPASLQMTVRLTHRLTLSYTSFSR